MPRLGESLGSPGNGRDAARALRLGEILIEMGFLEPRQLELALEEQQRTGQRLGAVLIAAGWISEARLVRALSRQLGIPMCDPVSAPVHERVRALVPRELAQRLHAVPIALKRTAEGDVLCLVTSDPLYPTLAEEIAAHLGMGVEVMLAGDTEIEVAIAKHYGTQAPSFVRGGGSLPPIHLSLPPLPPSSPPVKIVQGTPDIGEGAPIELDELVPESDDRLALMDALAGVGAVALSAELDHEEGLDPPWWQGSLDGPAPVHTAPLSFSGSPPTGPAPPPRGSSALSPGTLPPNALSGGLSLPPPVLSSSAPPLSALTQPSPPPSLPPLPPSLSAPGPSASSPSASASSPGTAVPPPLAPRSTSTAGLPSPSARPATSEARAISMPAPAWAPSAPPSPPLPSPSRASAPARAPDPAPGPRRIEAGAQGAFDPLEPRHVTHDLPSSQLDPVDSPRRGGFALPQLLSAGVELPEATASMVDASSDISPLTIPEAWQEVSFSGLVKGAPAPAPLPAPSGNWGDFFPSMTGSLPLVTEDSARDFSTRVRERDLLAPVPIVGLPQQSGRTVEELGIAPPSAFSREEKSLSIDIDVVELESPIAHEPTARTRLVDQSAPPPPVTATSGEDVIIDEVSVEEIIPEDDPEPLEVPPLVEAEPPAAVDASLRATAVPGAPAAPEYALDAPVAPPPEDVPTTRPSAASGVDAARLLFLRAASGEALTPTESTWLLRCLAGVLLDGLDDGRLASIVTRLGPPPG